MFESGTQAYREVLLGYTVARTLDRSIDIRLPYADQGASAFSGRSLDERAINPFLHDRSIPSSRGPYLSVFRRSVQFKATTGVGLRDKKGYEALLKALTVLEGLSDDDDLRGFLRYILYQFVELRESASIPLLRLHRISLEQYDGLIARLLATRSGGLFPVLLVVAMFHAVREVYELGWEISWQGINVADRASGVGGDVTISHNGQVAMAVEITERPVGKARVVATFNTKIAPAGIEDYLFVLSAGADDEARAQARQYFAQGHEVNFVDVREWLLMLLSTVGKAGRTAFNRELMAILDAQTIPKALRVAWNDSINAILAT